MLCGTCYVIFHHSVPSTVLQRQLDILPGWLRKLSVDRHGECGQSSITQINSYMAAPLPRRKTYRQDRVGEVLKRPSQTPPNAFAELSSGSPYESLLCLFLHALLKYEVPAWWSFLSTSHKCRLETFQARTLRFLLRTPRLIRNDVLHRSLRIPTRDTSDVRVQASLFVRGWSLLPTQNSATTTARIEHVKRTSRALLDEPPMLLYFSSVITQHSSIFHHARHPYTQ